MNFNKNLEERLKSKVMVYLEKGKPGWDIPHTLTSVYYIKKLIKKEGGNPKILITTMYLHDIGYCGLFKKGYGFENVMGNKSEHMKRGADEAEKILRELGSYNGNEIRQIVHLIEVHDKLDELITHDEILVMEADSLAQIDVKKVKPTFNGEDHLKFLQHFENDRIPRFKTKTGRELLDKLFERAKNYFN